MIKMSLQVKLSDIIDAMQFQTDESTSYLNRKTGEVITDTDEEIQAAEDGEPLEEYPEWEHDVIKVAREILDHEEDFIPLPSKFDIHEYNIMERFCLSIEDQEVSMPLYHAIKGRGAFSRFKEAIHTFGIANAWYNYRGEALKQIAIDWCDENKIRWV